MASQPIISASTPFQSFDAGHKLVMKDDLPGSKVPDRDLPISGGTGKLRGVFRIPCQPVNFALMPGQ
jgi:hypothetical protein